MSTEWVVRSQLSHCPWFLRNEQPHRQIDDKAGAAHHGEDDEDDPDQRDVDTEVVRQSAAHTSKHSIAPAAIQLLDRFDVASFVPGWFHAAPSDLMAPVPDRAMFMQPQKASRGIALVSPLALNRVVATIITVSIWSAGSTR